VATPVKYSRLAVSGIAASSQYEEKKPTMPSTPGIARARPLDAAVRTTSSWKEVGALCVGDELASIDGAPSRVTGVHPHGVRHVMRVTFSDGRATEACAESLWRVYGDEWDAPQSISTKQMVRLLESRTLWIDMPHGDFGHQDPLALDPWVLGAILADGVPAEAPAEEEDADDGDVAVAVRSASTRYNALSASLAGLGLLGLAREREFVPPSFANACRRARIALLQGLLDNDGLISNRSDITLAVNSPRLAADVAELARSVGGWCRVDACEGRYTLHLRHPDPRQIFRLASKKNRFLAGCGDNARIAVASIVPARMTPTQGITVSHPSRLYITDDYIVIQE
jgi:replicative DNA helicase